VKANAAGERFPAKETDGAAGIERELLFLGRALEALQRKRRYPLDRSGFLILRTLSENGPATVGKLARALLLDNSTMTRQIAALEANRLIARSAQPGDRRSGTVTATAAGEAMMREMLAARLKRVGRYVSGWTVAEQRAFATLLGRFNAAIAGALAE
jgi:DNA-binding MarR family transcriptional regulator